MQGRSFGVHYILVGLAAAMGFWLCWDWTVPDERRGRLVVEDPPLLSQLLGSAFVGLVVGVVAAVGHKKWMAITDRRTTSDVQQNDSG